MVPFAKAICDIDFVFSGLSPYELYYLALDIEVGVTNLAILYAEQLPIPFACW